MEEKANDDDGMIHSCKTVILFVVGRKYWRLMAWRNRKAKAAFRSPFSHSPLNCLECEWQRGFKKWCDPATQPQRGPLKCHLQMCLTHSIYHLILKIGLIATQFFCGLSGTCTLPKFCGDAIMFGKTFQMFIQTCTCPAFWSRQFWEYQWWWFCCCCWDLVLVAQSRGLG